MVAYVNEVCTLVSLFVLNGSLKKGRIVLMKGRPRRPDRGDGGTAWYVLSNGLAAFLISHISEIRTIDILLFPLI